MTEAEKGTLVHIPAGTKREAYNDGGTTHQKYAVAFDVDDPSGHPLLAETAPRFLNPRSFERLRERFDELYMQRFEQRPYFETISLGILLEIVGIVQRELVSPPLPKRKLHLAREMEQFIAEHYRERIPVKRLAERIGRSPNYAIALFKEATGQTPIEYQHRLRTTAATELLLHTRMTVADIAEHLGYYDASSFHKAFRRATGRSPGAFGNR
ncbi:AraC family transcriptional regulator [Paenibacillus sp.]|uniref:AraC family transcriptional regulator n=1 Tax=Paenibacillus sp. TaxID=58172 RepID=UPI002811A4A3|nr:AraC family transcriptional regulator [Paenibacillus sp.]